MTEPRPWPPLSPLGTGLGCRCPRCGRGRLLKGLLDVRDACDVCGLDLSPHDTGDGATVFVILFLGALVVALAIWLEAAVEPPIWVHLLVWIPTILVLSVALLRPFKGVLIALHYRNLRHKYDHGNGGA
ncbi:MAG: DUF983 domain-containing protein [Rhodospirillaceae bacterium]